MQQQETLVQEKNFTNDNQCQSCIEKNQKLYDPIMKKDFNTYKNIKNDYFLLSVQNKQLRLENESLKQKLNGFDNLEFQLRQQEKQIESLSIQTVQNQNLQWANARHINEISRYIQLLEYKQEHIKSLQQLLKEVCERNKLKFTQYDLPIPEDLENKSHLNDDDKYFVDQEYKKQKEYQEFKKRYQQYKGQIKTK